jgi:hypothetical protein
MPGVYMVIDMSNRRIHSIHNSFITLLDKIPIEWAKSIISGNLKTGVYEPYCSIVKIQVDEYRSGSNVYISRDGHLNIVRRAATDRFVLDRCVYL